MKFWIDKDKPTLFCIVQKDSGDSSTYFQYSGQKVSERTHSFNKNVYRESTEKECREFCEPYPKLKAAFEELVDKPKTDIKFYLSNKSVAYSIDGVEKTGNLERGSFQDVFSIVIKKFGYVETDMWTFLDIISDSPSLIDHFYELTADLKLPRIGKSGSPSLWMSNGKSARWLHRDNTMETSLLSNKGVYGIQPITLKAAIEFLGGKEDKLKEFLGIEGKLANTEPIKVESPPRVAGSLTLKDKNGQVLSVGDYFNFDKDAVTYRVDRLPKYEGDADYLSYYTHSGKLIGNSDFSTGYIEEQAEKCIPDFLSTSLGVKRAEPVKEEPVKEDDEIIKLRDKNCENLEKNDYFRIGDAIYRVGRLPKTKTDNNYLAKYTKCGTFVQLVGFTPLYIEEHAEKCVPDFHNKKETEDKSALKVLQDSENFATIHKTSFFTTLLRRPTMMFTTIARKLFSISRWTLGKSRPILKAGTWVLMGAMLANPNFRESVYQTVLPTTYDNYELDHYNIDNDVLTAYYRINEGEELLSLENYMVREDRADDVWYSPSGTVSNNFTASLNAYLTRALRSNSEVPKPGTVAVSRSLTSWWN